MLAVVPALRCGSFPVHVPSVWPSGLRRQTQVLVERSAWVQTPQLTFFVLKSLFVSKRILRCAVSSIRDLFSPLHSAETCSGAL